MQDADEFDRNMGRRPAALLGHFLCIDAVHRGMRWRRRHVGRQQFPAPPTAAVPPLPMAANESDGDSTSIRADAVATPPEN